MWQLFQRGHRLSSQCGAVSHDLIKGAINPGISEKSELLAARISMAVSILVATILGLNLPRETEAKTLRAFGKLLWIQNDLITRHYQTRTA